MKTAIVSLAVLLFFAMGLVVFEGWCILDMVVQSRNAQVSSLESKVVELEREISSFGK